LIGLKELGGKIMLYFEKEGFNAIKIKSLKEKAKVQDQKKP
jgi:hypothetical protein